MPSPLKFNDLAKCQWEVSGRPPLWEHLDETETEKERERERGKVEKEREREKGENTCMKDNSSEER